ncbi:hypothetical protein ZHAS_00015301 [Anopheles sinensis]|uniref:Uncharacterized protein n=1 Tax=Anopheles sinensis TaxID=74873 RepID=A0A084WAM9_ANOSI|nr:hypothetical protein ZHAS_00015301 [Anopheles sinensis]
MEKKGIVFHHITRMKVVVESALCRAVNLTPGYVPPHVGEENNREEHGKANGRQGGAFPAVSKQFPASLFRFRCIEQDLIKMDECRASRSRNWSGLGFVFVSAFDSSAGLEECDYLYG